MEMTQQDFDERKARIDKGEGTDEDRRLVKQYESAGYTPGTDAESAGKPTLSERRAAAGDTGSDIVGGVPVHSSESTSGSKSDASKTSRGSRTGN